jgi:hypothetical protein
MSNETKQTAVDWLYNELTTKSGVSKEDWAKMILKAFTEAKQMEKEQIKDAYWNGSDSYFEHPNKIMINAEEFYFETYINNYANN